MRFSHTDIFAFNVRIVKPDDTNPSAPHQLVRETRREKNSTVTSQASHNGATCESQFSGHRVIKGLAVARDNIFLAPRKQHVVNMRGFDVLCEVLRENQRTDVDKPRRKRKKSEKSTDTSCFSAKSLSPGQNRM
ncbi:hypothetical protein AVEN_232220-1 [Araneus ventricosus]|uniref:Uncharacterized protein n=1 Tax=Araneus ventricosus TaxID=182803 RepID=A0A4Y2JYX3_ARAVE|nr:hypothetical protein AVEN_232220-1 [Araneus ventricosus]